MVTSSSILTWEIPWTEEPGGLQSVGSQSVRHDKMLPLTTNSKANIFIVRANIK